jgi:Tol biopolymer transport system component
MRRRLIAVLATLVPLAVALQAAPASATYKGKNGELAWESFASTDNGVGPPGPQETDTVETRARTLAVCDGTSGPLPCEFGAPSYSPDGRTAVFSRLVPTNALNDEGDQGQLEIVGSDGSDPSILPRQTADDEHPAFLPSRNAIVFDGRSTETATPNLYTVATDGGGLFQLTSNGGSEPAPCGNGTIAFVRNANIYLLHPSSGAVRQLTRRGGSSPSCAPNSHQIAFVRGVTLYTIGSSGRHLHRVTKTPAYSPDGTELAFLTSYNVLTQNGTQTALEVVNLKGRLVEPKLIVANTSFSGDSGVQDTGYASGDGWQPAIASKLPLTRAQGSPVSTGNASSVDAVAISPDDRLLAGLAADGAVSLFSIRYSGGAVTRFKLLPSALPSSPAADSVAFDSSGDLLAIGRQGGQISEYTVDSSTGALTPVPGSPFSTGDGRAVTALAFSPNESLLAAATTGGGVAVFSVDEATHALTPAPGSPFPTVAGAPASSLAFNADATKLVAVWPNGLWLFSVDASTGALSAVTGSPFGDLRTDSCSAPRSVTPVPVRAAWGSSRSTRPPSSPRARRSPPEPTRSRTRSRSAPTASCWPRATSAARCHFSLSVAPTWRVSCPTSSGAR